MEPLKRGRGRGGKQTAQKQTLEEKKATEVVVGERLDELMLAAITNEGLKVFALACGAYSKEDLIEVKGMPSMPTAEIAKFSPLTGKLLAVVEPQGVHVIEVLTMKEKKFFPKVGIASL